MEQIETQERDLDFEQFGHRDAWQVGSWLVERALDQNLPVTIAIWLGEQRVFHSALPGTSADNDHWVARKAAVVRRYDAASLRTTLRWKALGVGHDVSVIGLSPHTHALSGGAFPIRVRARWWGSSRCPGWSMWTTTRSPSRLWRRTWPSPPRRHSPPT